MQYITQTATHEGITAAAQTNTKLRTALINVQNDVRLKDPKKKGPLELLSICRPNSQIQGSQSQKIVCNAVSSFLDSPMQKLQKHTAAIQTRIDTLNDAIIKIEAKARNANAQTARVANAQASARVASTQAKARNANAQAKARNANAQAKARNANAQTSARNANAQAKARNANAQASARNTKVQVLEDKVKLLDKYIDWMGTKFVNERADGIMGFFQNKTTINAKTLREQYSNNTGHLPKNVKP